MNMKESIFKIILFFMKIRNYLIDGVFINISGDNEIAKEIAEKIWRKL